MPYGTGNKAMTKKGRKTENEPANVEHGIYPLRRFGGPSASVSKEEPSRGMNNSSLRSPFYYFLVCSYDLYPTRHAVIPEVMRSCSHVVIPAMLSAITAEKCDFQITIT